MCVVSGCRLRFLANRVYTTLRCSQFRVKMTTSDDEMTTDIVAEGDKEEIERFCKVRVTSRYSVN